MILLTRKPFAGEVDVKAVRCSSKKKTNKHKSPSPEHLPDHDNYIYCDTFGISSSYRGKAASKVTAANKEGF